MKRVVLMLDGSPESAAAAHWVGDHLGGTEVVAVTTVSPFGAFVLGLPPSRAADWMPEIRRALEERWCAPLRDAGVPFRTHLLSGSPAPAIVDLARREDAEAIVVGKPARSFLSEHLLGSVAADLVHHAAIPVIVVPFA